MSSAQDFFIAEEFGSNIAGIRAALFDSEDTIDVSAQYNNKAQIRVKESVFQDLFNYWSDSNNMNESRVENLYYRVNYTDTACPLTPDFVVGAIVTSTSPNMNPDNLLTNYLPQDYLRHLSKQMFNSTRGVDLFDNEQSVLESVDIRCKLAFRATLNSLSGIIRDGDNYVIDNPLAPTQLTGSSMAGTNPAQKIMKQLLKRDPARFTDLTAFQIGTSNWFKVPILKGDSVYFPITIGSPLHQQQLVISSSSTEIVSRTYLLRCVVVADNEIPVPYDVVYSSALQNLNTFYHV